MAGLGKVPMRMLIVEDSTSMRMALREYVQRFLPRVAIDEAATGSEALSAAARQAPDVVLLDLGLPDIDGIELCVRLRAQSAEMRIIVVTWLTGEAYANRARQAGARAYVTKDRLLDEIIPTIEGALGV